MRIVAWIKVTLSAAAIAGFGVAVWAVLDKLDEKTFSLFVGMAIVLVIVVVVGLLFLGYGVSQAYVQRRMLQQDAIADLKQMTVMGALLRGGQPSVRVNVPERTPASADPWASWSQSMIPPTIQDTTGTDAGTIEIE